MKKSHIFKIKRVYEGVSKKDGVCFLVDRVWPRGVRKETLSDAKWLKDVAPSTALRKWFGHDPDKWNEFREKYRAELKENQDTWKPLLEAVKTHNVTLLFSAKDIERNQAVVLKNFLEGKK